MAKDDYYVIVYRILAYLYRSLKEGEDINPNLLEPESKYLRVNRKYWQYIFERMQEQGFIDGVQFIYAFGHELIDYDLSGCEITPLGIEYLCENSSIKKHINF